THYRGFIHRGFRIAWVFDASPEKVGQKIGELTVQSIADLEQVIHANQVQMAMLAVPAEFAQGVADRLVAAGIRAILNYAPINLNVPDGVKVEYIDPVIHMQHMTYYLHTGNGGK
nr:redox-sensing transcriptional repressor Rex [Anaerolineae bacterium]